MPSSSSSQHDNQSESQSSQHRSSAQLPESVEKFSMITYRSTGLGLYGALMRFVGMPLEKIALIMNSTQVTGDNQLRQAIQLAFQDASGKNTTSLLAPYRVVGPASGVAWFLQYSVMGMVFQVCDSALSEFMNVPRMPYGAQLMEDPKLDNIQQNSHGNNGNVGVNAHTEESSDAVMTAVKTGTKIILTPALAGIIESIVANRAEVQRYYGISKFSQIESSLKWTNPIKRICGPAFWANSSRNFIMSSTSFVVTPVLYRNFYPQEQKSNLSLFWFGLGVNVFIGNPVAITQQALWGRALDYASSPSGVGNNTGAIARNIRYKEVIQEGLAKEGRAAFFTVPKWASRVMMNAPVQGTLPWFYNEILPLGEETLMSTVRFVYWNLVGNLNGSGSGNVNSTSAMEMGMDNGKRGHNIATSPKK